MAILLLFWGEKEILLSGEKKTVDKCPPMDYNSLYTTAEVAEAISTFPVGQLPGRKRSFRRRVCLPPRGHFLGPRRICAELSSDSDGVLPGRTDVFALRSARGFYVVYGM